MPAKSTPKPDSPPDRQAAVQTKLKQGLALHQYGRLAQAQALYEEILEIQPLHFDALHLSGVIAFQTQNSLRAVELISEALELNPNNAAAHSNLGNAYKALDLPQAALESYDQAITLKPDYADALSNRGVILLELEQHEAALESLDKSIALKPDFAEAHYNRGNALQGVKRHDAALESYDRAIALKPDYADAHSNRGIVLLELERPEAALESLDRAIALKPDFAKAHYTRGNALQGMNRHNAALESYDRAIAFKPDYANAYYNRGLVLGKLKRHQAALESFDQAIKLKPDYAEAYNDRGCTLQLLRQPQAALESLARAIALKADYAEAYFSRGNVLKDQQQFQAALEDYSHALALRPDYTSAYTNLLFLHGYHASLSPDAYLALARGWELACIPEQERQLAHARTFKRPPLAGRRLKLGYMSGDFRQHAVSYFMERLFTCHDPARIELFAYSTHDLCDAVTERMQAQVEHWVPVAGMKDTTILERILTDEIDVLIDLSGHTAHNALGVFARRAAPVQAHYLGYFASTGLSEMDYWIGDDTLTPAETDSHYSEQIWRLPRVWVSYDGKADAPVPDWQPAQDGSVWLGSFNNLVKLTPATLALWAKVLHALPQGKLLLKTGEFGDSSNRKLVLDALAAHGISADRIELQDRRSTPDWPAHMACYNRLDIALDPLGGVGGGTTTCDALWMGVPIITLEGGRMASRMTATMLHAIDRPEWIARTEAEYLDKVIALARDAELHTALRTTQRARMAASPLCDARDLAINLEHACREMFERWQQQVSAQAQVKFQQGLALHQSGQLTQAQALYEEILEIQPLHFDALHLSGVIAFQTQNPQRAVELIGKALELNPNNAAAHSNLGNAYRVLGLPQPALESYEQAITLKPDYADAHSNRGVVLLDLERYEAALESLDRSIALKPDFAEAHYNRGNALQGVNRRDAALDSYDRAIALKPDYVAAYYNRGNALQNLKRHQAALESYDEAVRLNPAYAEAYNNRGNALRDLGRHQAALKSFGQAIKLKPDYAEAYNNRGCTLQLLRQPQAALESYSHALTLRPDYANAYTNMLFLYSYHASLPPDAYLALARGWELACVPEQERQLAHARTFKRPPLAGRRLRLGYVSGDFRQHAVSYFMERLFTCHDPARIELFAYSSHDLRDAVTERMQAQVEHWVPVAGMADTTILERILTDEIDVLIDLSGHTAHNALGVFARRAAPVQAHYLGYFASTGLSEMDYWIGDDTLTPAETDSHFSEQVWRLPRVWVSYDDKTDAPVPDWLPAQDGSVWLGSFNNLGKLTPTTLALWAKVLHALPQGKLLLKTGEFSDSGNRKLVLDALAAHGISADRIELHDRRTTPDWPAHMAYYNRLDIALDPLGGVGGGTTTCDALWMGVPVITLEGNRMASRMTATMLHAIDRPEWITRTEAEYLDKVVALARDVALRTALRTTQRERMAASPLCDARDLAINLEHACREMFERWQQQALNAAL